MNDKQYLIDDSSPRFELHGRDFYKKNYALFYILGDKLKHKLCYTKLVLIK